MDPAVGTVRHGLDGVSLACIYVLLLLIVPARLVLSFVPMTLPPGLVVALGLAVLWISAHMVDTLSMAKGRNVLRTALGLYFMAHLMTYAVATRRYLPSDELRVADSSMVRLVAMVGLAAFICDGVRTREQLDRLLRVLAGSVAVVAIVGLVQFAVGFDLVGLINLPGLRAQENGYAAFEARSVFRRPAGTTNHPIEFGIVCAMAVPLTVYHALHARQRGRSAAWWVMCASLVALGAILSLSRTALLGLAIAAVTLAVTLPRGRKLPVLGSGLVAFLGLTTVVPGLFGTLRGMFVNIENDPSVKGRTADYAKASAEIGERPWLGRGFGTFLPERNPILDNQYLLTTIENGYVGVTVLIGIFVASLVAAIRTWRMTADPALRSLAGCLGGCTLIAAMGAITFDLLAFGVATGSVFVLIGASGAALRIARSGPQAGPRRRPPAPRPAPAPEPASGNGAALSATSPGGSRSERDAGSHEGN